MWIILHVGYCKELRRFFVVLNSCFMAFAMPMNELCAIENDMIFTLRHYRLFTNFARMFRTLFLKTAAFVLGPYSYYGEEK